MKKITALMILVCIAFAAGISVAIFTAPISENTNSKASHSKEKLKDGKDEVQLVKLNNQFVVPIIKRNHRDAVVVISLSIEIDGISTEIVYSSEPKLRDTFLQAMFKHANAGGFSGVFTNENSMGMLKDSLKKSAKTVLGNHIKDVFITDIIRQES